MNPKYLRRARRLSAIARGEAFERVDASGRFRKLSRPPSVGERIAAIAWLDALDRQSETAPEENP